VSQQEKCTTCNQPVASLIITAAPIPSDHFPLITTIHSNTRFYLQFIHVLFRNVFPCLPGPSHCLAPPIIIILF